MALSNRTTRIVVSAVAIPAIVAIVFAGKLWFTAFFAIVGALAYYEFSGILSQNRIDNNLYFGVTATVLVILNGYFGFVKFEFLFALLVVSLSVVELFRNKTSFISGTAGTLFGIIYIGYFLSTGVMLREFYNFSDALYIQGGYLIFTIFASIWICDSAAYFLGVAFGKHKIFPRVSPKKSWEGSIAGFLFAFAAVIAGKVFLVDFLNWTDIVVIAFVVGVFGQIGDFIESVIKRNGHVKDSSTLIPGHGGVFDRFDSFIFSAPIIYFYLLLFA